MDYTRAAEMTRKLTRDGGVLDYGPKQARLLLRILRTLAQGRPVTGTDLGSIADDLGWPREEAHAFLRALTERDAADRIVGVLGLSLAKHPYGFTVNGHRMATWCAEDTLFFPRLLGQRATIESMLSFAKTSSDSVDDSRCPGQAEERQESLHRGRIRTAGSWGLSGHRGEMWSVDSMTSVTGEESRA